LSRSDDAQVRAVEAGETQTVLHRRQRRTGSRLDQREAAPGERQREDPDGSGVTVVAGVDLHDRAADVADAGVVRGWVPLPAHARSSSRYPVLSLSATTGQANEPMPSMVTSTVSPTCMGPTPSGVPVSTTSPGPRVMKRLMYDSTSGTEKIMSRVVPSCFSSPFPRVWTRTANGSRSVSSHGPTGQKPSADFPRTHFRSLRCVSRAVTSMAQL